MGSVLSQTTTATATPSPDSLSHPPNYFFLSTRFPHPVRLSPVGVDVADSSVISSFLECGACDFMVRLRPPFVLQDAVLPEYAYQGMYSSVFLYLLSWE